MTCPSCREATGSGVSAGVEPERERVEPGASLGREYERRKSARELRNREAHPHIGGLLLTLRDPPQHEVAFRRGELGEKAVAGAIEMRTANGLALTLYNRRMPKGHGDIDLIAIAASGVFVIDAKDSTGRVRVTTPLFGAPKLLIDGRNRTKLVDGLDRQVAAVRAALDAAGRATVPIQGVLCFTKADLPLFGAAPIRGHLLLYRKALAQKLSANGVIEPVTIDELALELNRSFPPA